MMARFSLLVLLALSVLNGCARAASLPGMTSVHVPLPRGFHPQTLAAADFNGDGRTDVALCGTGEQLLVLAGDGQGGLRPIPQEARCGAHPTQMIAADLDGDGRVDLAVANHATSYLTVLHNEGGGRFTARQVMVPSKPHPHTVAAADVDSDGHIDLITDSWGEKRLTLLLADGHGGWQSPGIPLDTGREPYVNVVAADLDGDGHVDLVMPNAGPDSGSDTVSILFGDGHGHFRHAAQSPIAGGPIRFMVAVADVTGDGRPDIVIANSSGHITDTSRDGLTWIGNDGQRHFTAFPQRIAIGHGCWRIAGGDINGDGVADTAFINAADGTVSIAYGSANGPRPGSTVAAMPEPHNVVMANLHHGKRADLLVITDDHDELLILSLP